MSKSRKKPMYTFAVISLSYFYEFFIMLVYLIEPRACQRSHIWQIPPQSDRRGKLCQGSQSTPCCGSAFHQTSPLPETVHRRLPPCYSQSPLQLCLEIYISSNPRNLLRFLQFMSSVTVHCKGDRRKT
jgi:hypothetical protein